MRRGVVGVAVLAALSLGPRVHAADADMAFQKVAARHWAYASVRLFETEGYSTGSPDGTFDGRRPLTRYDFAVAVERIYKGLQQRALNPSDAAQVRADVRELDRLLAEFGADISDLGVDVAEMRRQVDAIEERVGRGPAAPAAQRVTAPRTPLARALRRALLSPSSLSQAPQTRLPGYLSPSLAPQISPGLAAGFGPATIGFNVPRPGSMAAPDKAPFAGNLDLNGYLASFSLGLGAYSFDAYYNRQGLLGLLSDPYGLSNPFVNFNPREGVGSRVSGPFFNERLHFLMEAARLQSLNDDLGKALYFNAQFEYRFGGGLRLGVGYETIRAFTLGQMQDGQAFTLGVSKPLNNSVSFGVLMKYFSPGIGLGEFGARPDFSNSSAITQFSVKF